MVGLLETAMSQAASKLRREEAITFVFQNART